MALLNSRITKDEPTAFLTDKIISHKSVCRYDGTYLAPLNLNPDQYFEGVPAVAWEFHIGGYQPAQKSLKDRKGRALSFDDVMHYQKIIKILSETDRIMKEINLPL